MQTSKSTRWHKKEHRDTKFHLNQHQFCLFATYVKSIPMAWYVFSLATGYEKAISRSGKIMSSCIISVLVVLVLVVLVLAVGYFGAGCLPVLLTRSVRRSWIASISAIA